MVRASAEQLHKLFKNFIPIGQLSEEHCARLFASAQLEELAPRSLIDPSEESNQFTYVLHGEITCLSGGRVLGNVKSGTRRALLPLFGREQETDRAVSQLGARVVHFDRGLYQHLHDVESGAVSEAVEIGLSGVENDIFMEISTAFSKGQLELPNFPDVALQIRRAVSDPDIGVTEVSQIVQADPVLTARMMQVANSPLYRGWKDVLTVRDAVSRLGLESTRTLATTLALKQLFKAKSAMIKRRMQSMYQHSAYVSAIAYVLAQRHATLDGERALLAGLIFDIGIIPILTYADEHADRVTDETLLERAIDKLTAPVGAIVLSSWDFDAALIDMVEAGENWHRKHDDESDYTDVVLAARWLAHLDTERADRVPAMRDVPALERMGLEDGDLETAREFLEDARDEIEVVHQLLQV
jgi:HD-like signal output (HDOD) protein